MSLFKRHFFLVCLVAGLSGLLVWSELASGAARPGGGHSYGGSRSSGGGSGGSGGGSGEGLFFLLELIFRLIFYYPKIGIPLLLIVIVWFLYSSRHSQVPSYSSRTPQQWEPLPSPATISQRSDALRVHDPNFSEILFMDFVAALYGRVHEARGRRELEPYRSFVSLDALNQLAYQTPADVVGVTGIVLGSATIIDFSPVSEPVITLTVEFETNYTELNRNGEGQTTWYARERWAFQRKRDLLSRPPEKITVDRCPKCNGPLEKRQDGSCAFCGVMIMGGDFDWFVIRIELLSREDRGPALTQDVPEQGTDLPTVFQPNVDLVFKQFTVLNPTFQWGVFEKRVQHIFHQIYQAWTSLDWEQARPFETDNVFQMHRYWIREYERQGLRNVLKDIQIARIDLAKVKADAFFDAITVRIFASCIDYTADLAGTILSGKPNKPRIFSEYWTFIRRRGVAAVSKGNSSCPNCGAPLHINMAGVCEYCGSKITSGDFDWVLSRIEQDDAYRG